MNSATAIQLSVAELLAFLTLLLGVLFAIGRMLVTMVSKSLQAKLDALERTASALESEVEALNRQLPLEYVRREDWIRFSTSIDAKLDRLAERLNTLLTQRVTGAH